MIEAFITAIFGVLFGFGYKVATIIKARRPVVNAYFLILSWLGVTGLACSRETLVFNRVVVIAGLGAGASLYFCTAAFFQVMRYGRLAIQWTLINMAIAVPVAASIVFWNERPTAGAAAGMVLVVIAVVFMGVDKGASAHEDDSGEGYNPALGKAAHAKWLGLIFVSVFGTGLCQTCNKALIAYGQADHTLSYLLVTYGTASLFSLVQLVWQRIVPTRRDLALSLFMAVTGVATLWCTLVGLSRMPSTIFFPARATFSTALAVVGSLLLWKEKVHRPGIIGLIVALAAIVCLSLA